MNIINGSLGRADTHCGTGGGHPLATCALHCRQPSCTQGTMDRSTIDRTFRHQMLNAFFTSTSSPEEYHIYYDEAVGGPLMPLAL